MQRGTYLQTKGRIAILGFGLMFGITSAYAGLDSVHEGNLQVTGTLEANSSGTPNLVSGDNGDLYVQDQLEVDGAVSIHGSVFTVETTWDQVNVNDTASGGTGKLVVGGDVAIKKSAVVPAEESDYAKFYSKVVGSYVEMFALDEDANYTQLSSHADPRIFDPDVATSFGDPSIEVPFSFHHGNLYLGKGAVVDLAALVSEVERMTGRDLTVEYDLPPDERRTLEDRQARLVQRTKQKILEETPEVEISIRDAWEEVLVTEVVQSTEQVTEYVYDLDTLTVSPISVERTVLSEVETGETTRQLKGDVRFDEATGKFYRKRTVDDVQLESPPDLTLPDWILSRLQQE